MTRLGGESVLLVRSSCKLRRNRRGLGLTRPMLSIHGKMRYMSEGGREVRVREVGECVGGVYRRISVEARRKSLRLGDGSALRIVSRWKLGVFAEYMVLSRGWEVRAVEWSVGVIGNGECVEH